MKKLIILLLTLTVLLSCAACGAPAPTEPNPSDDLYAPAENVSPAKEDTGSESSETTKPVTPNVSRFVTDTVTAVAAFETHDMDGNTVTEDFFSQYTLTMVNFWEPWCGPCVGEMPELQRLYENYSAKGFAILGVYSTLDGVPEVISDSGVTYPIVSYVSAFDVFQTGYVPTTIFVNSNGEVISLPVAGSNNYDGWAEVVEYYLG